jgi:acyl transferase domain-containing protein
MTSIVEPVAIVGFAGKFPGASDCAALWRLLSEGREGLRTLTDEQLLAAGVPPEALSTPNYVRVNGDIDGLELFDAPFFRMTPREATICDPQLRIFLETAHAAIENAGYDPNRLSDVGVFAATGHSLYMDHQLQGTALAAGERDLLAGVFNYPDYVATLTSYKLDFTGPSMTVLTACSSSLLTLHLATQALNNGECDMALIGGTEVETWNQGYFWNSGGPLSRDGHCRPFDAHATGTVFSTGVGAVVLKRLPDAIRDGDLIRAVVRATAVNNDGADKVGFSAPSMSGQTAVVAEALGVADVDPESIGYVEAHGTGTALGDPIEFAALNEAFRRVAGPRTLPTGYCGLGSVKSNIGHLGHAAGVVSLIKVAQCFQHDLMPATINLKEPNPALALDDSPFYLLTEARPWPRTPGRPRRAGINSLGFGGTNVHAVLEEPPLPARAPVAERPRLVVWSARNDAAEREYRTAFADHLRGSADEEFPAAVSTLQEGRSRHPVRGFAVAASRPEAIDAVLRGSLSTRTVPSGGPRPLAFLFPGQGSQHTGMAAGLYRADPTFTAEMDAALDALAKAGAQVRPLWTDGSEDQLLDTAVAQPLLFAVEYALAKMLLGWGVTPAGMIGHSVGELVAAAVAGMIPLPAAAAMVAARGRAMAAAPPGAMAAVRAGAADLGELPEGVTVAAENGPQQTVVAGTEGALSGYLSTLASRGVAAARLRTAYAFHSPSMAASAEAFAGELPPLVASPAAIPVVSAATARPLTVSDAGSAEFWAEQIRSPVHFSAALDEMLGTRDWLLLEVGPGRALTSVLRGHPGVTTGRHDVLPTLPGRQGEVDDLRCVLAAVGAVWTEGHELDWAAQRPGEPLRRTAIPGYQYQRRAYWARPDHQGRSERPAVEPDPVAVAPAVATPSAFSVLGWVERPAPAPARGADAPAAVLLPPDPRIALHLVVCLQQAGLRVVPLRAGEHYSDKGSEIVVRPGRPEDLGQALRSLAARGRPVHRLVHAWGVGAGADDSTVDQAGLVLRSLVDLVQQGARAWPDAAPDVLVLAERSVDVSGGEPVDLARAGLPALVRTLSLELGGGSCRLVDIGTGVSESELAAELMRDEPEPVVALRRDRRWTPIERGCVIPEPGSSPLRRGGVYLVTAGWAGSVWNWPRGSPAQVCVRGWSSSAAGRWTRPSRPARTGGTVWPNWPRSVPRCTRSPLTSPTYARCAGSPIRSRRGSAR